MSVFSIMTRTFEILFKSPFLPTLFATVLCQPCTFAQTPVAVATPSVESTKARFQFTGTITSDREASLSPRVAGLVVEADAEMGYAAKQGELLVRLDDTLAQMDLQEKELNLQAAMTELANAKRRLEEAVELGDANFPRSEKENRETTYRMAEISVRRLETLVATQKEIVDRHKIVAPFKGIVVKKNAELGEWVQTGNPVLRFVDTENLRLDIQVPQEQLSLVNNSKTVTVHVAGARETAFEATIEARSPLVDPQTRTFQVRIRLENPPAHIKPGMSADAIFKPVSETPKLFISRDAILRTANNEVIVWVAERNGPGYRASKRTVQLGSSSGESIEVRNGLKASDEVIYQGNESLREGQELRIVGSITPTNSR